MNQDFVENIILANYNQIIDYNIYTYYKYFISNQI